MSDITNDSYVRQCPSAPKVTLRKKFYKPDTALLIALSSKVPPNKTDCISLSQFCHFHKTSIQKLTRLDLSNCNLSIFPECLAKILPNLRHLDLSGNKFKCIPSALHIIAGLNKNLIIILSDNPIDFTANHPNYQLKNLQRAGASIFIDTLKDFAPSDDDSL